MANIAVHNRYSFSLRTMVIAFVFVSLAIGGATSFVRWLERPRVADWQVRDRLSAEFPPGTPREQVEKAIQGRYQFPKSFNDSAGHTVLQCWILDTGQPLTFFPDDVRIQFTFDVQSRLINVAVVSESRF